jgi:hypothetical protein
MATTVFTTWAAYRDFLLDKLATLDPSVVSVNVRGKEMTYRPENIERLLAYAEMRAAQEEGAGACLRTYAKQGGRGE